MLIVGDPSDIDPGFRRTRNGARWERLLAPGTRVEVPPFDSLCFTLPVPAATSLAPKVRIAYRWR